MNKILSMSQWETRIGEAYSLIRISKVSSEQERDILERYVFSELHRTYNKHGKPSARRVYNQYIAGFVQGLIRAEVNQNYRQHLEFCYDVDGILYSTHKDTDKLKTELWYSKGIGSQLADYPSGHYWKNSDKKYF